MRPAIFGGKTPEKDGGHQSTQSTVTPGHYAEANYRSAASRSQAVSRAFPPKAALEFLSRVQDEVRLARAHAWASASARSLDHLDLAADALSSARFALELDFAAVQR